MKQINNYIIERLHINKNTESIYKDHKDPIIGKTAYDYYGEPWEIIDFCKLDDNGNLQKLIKKYDSNGAFKDFMDEFSPEEYNLEYAVAAEAIDTPEYTIFVWGYDGLCFENKPKKHK